MTKISFNRDKSDLSVSFSAILYFWTLLSANPTKWPNTFKQFVGRLPTNCFSVFGHFVKLALKGLTNIYLLNNFNFMAPFSGWGSTASRLEQFRGGSLLFTNQFPEIPGTRFIDLGRMKGWVDLGATQWFWTGDSWIGNTATIWISARRTLIGHERLKEAGPYLIFWKRI